MSIELILKYFPGLSPQQTTQMGMLGELYASWNERMNLVSRKDLENLYERHILHSLAVARVVRFRQGARILDAGTGGGFPGVPLAILFPGCTFHLVDATAKKLAAVKGIADSIGLKNLTVEHARLENLPGKYDFVLGRALASLPRTMEWTWKNIEPAPGRGHGLIYLKGGDFPEKLAEISCQYKVFDIRDFFEEEYFITKKIVYLIKD